MGLKAIGPFFGGGTLRLAAISLGSPTIRFFSALERRQLVIRSHKKGPVANAIAPHVLRSNRVQPPSTSAMTGEGYQFLQPEQIHQHRAFPATMLPNVCSTFAICIWGSAFASLRSSGVLSSSNSFANGLPNGVSLPFVGSPSCQSVEHFREARLVSITHGGLAIWLYPFGMLDPQIVVNLLPKLGVGVDLVSHRHWLGERFKCAAEHFLQSLAGIADQRWRRGARANNSQRPNVLARGVCGAEPTRSLCGAGVATTPPAIRFA